MTLVQFLRIVVRHAKFILFLPLILFVLVFFLTMNQPKEYKNNTLIYTGIASTSDALGEGSARIDNYAVNNSFDNLLNLISSREILERTGLKLFALHLVQSDPNPEIIGDDLFRQLDKIVSKELRDVWVVKNNPDSTFNRLWAERSTDRVRQFTDNDKLPYCPEYIESNLKLKRAGTSDMLEMTYTSYDAAVTQHTLNILTEIFIQEFKSLKSQDAQNLVTFFLSEAKTANDRLNVISDELKQYRIGNGIINYDEQTKQLTVEEMYMNAEFREEMRKYAASEALLLNLNIKLGDRTRRALNNQTIIDIREKLSAAMSNVLVAESIDPNSKRSAQMKQEVITLREELTNSLTILAKMSHTEEGTNIALLEQQWITQYINSIEGKVRIDVLKERRNEFRGRFNKFAPLGSALHKYERDIDVAEKEYLELLHSLNLARLRQQNLEASTTIKVLDKPVLPLKTESSKRFLMLIGAWFIGVILCISGIIALELLDRSIRTPERATIFSRLPIVAVSADRSQISRSIEHEMSIELIRKQTLRNIKLELSSLKHSSTQHIIIVASMQKNEGKSTISTEIASLLALNGSSVAILSPHEQTMSTNSENVLSLPYFIPSNFSNVRSYIDLNPKQKQPLADFVIIELPSMQENELPIQLIESAQMFLFVMRADRIWRKSDSVLLSYISFNNGPLIRGIVNGVQLDRVEEFVGELPKRRSTFRKFVKRLAEFRLVKV